MTRLLALIAAFLATGQAVGRAHGELQQTLASVTASITQSPEDAALYFHRAELRRLHDDGPGAEADYLRAAALQPELPGVNFGLAHIKSDQGRNAEALLLIDRFLAQCPAHPEALALRAELHEKRGAWRLADADLAAACASATECNYVTLRAALLERHGDIDGALRCLDDANRVRARVPLLEQQALGIAERAGRLDAAIQRVDALIACEPRPDLWLARKAAILTQAGRRADAHASWTLARQALLKLPPDRLALKSNLLLATQIDAGLTATATPPHHPASP